MYRILDPCLKNRKVLDNSKFMALDYQEVTLY